MVGTVKSRVRANDRAFYAIAAAFLFVCVVSVLTNRLRGLGYFDGSEYALHIQGGGIAHAPGYPLFTLLGKVIHGFGADPFLSQQIISIVALSVAAFALYETFALEVGTTRSGFAGAVAVAVASLSASYYLRLFSILPEVFVLNVALFSLLILAITRYYYFPGARNLGLVWFVYGLGLCHHHTLAFTLPACLYLVASKFRRLKPIESIAYSCLGFAAGCLPLLYLFRNGRSVDSTYYRVHDFSSLMFVLLRKGYGTFHLSPLNSEPDIGGLYRLTMNGLLENFNGLGALVFLPLVLWRWRGPSSSNDERSKVESTQEQRAYRLTSPSLLVAVSTLALFLLVFIPNCNLELGVRSYRTIFLRFLTIPCFLLAYLAFKAALCAWDFSAQWGRARQLTVISSMLGCLAYASLGNGAGLRYGNCDLLDEHVRHGYSAIFSQLNPQPSLLDSQRHQCAIFAQGDTLLMGIKYYNEFVATKKCYVFSSTSLTGQFLDRRELALAAKTLGLDLARIESGELATHPEALLNLFLRLDKEGYGLFVFSVTDYTGYFGKMFVNSPFAYRPLGNILQVVTETSMPFGMDKMYASYESYVTHLEAYVGKLAAQGVPTAVVDSQANQALILNLADYAKFARFYPAPREDVQRLQARAESVQAKWFELLPRE